MSETNKEYRLSPLARADLSEIWAYTFETWSPDQADHYHGQIINALEGLAKDPDRGRDMNHVRQDYLRGSGGSHFIFIGKHPTG